MPALRVISATSTELFVGPVDAPLQIVEVAYAQCGAPVQIEIAGVGLSGAATATPGEGRLEIPVSVRDPVIGEIRAAQVCVEGAESPFDFVVAEPGWTMYMISHFHYDPVWWNTQAAYTSVWTEQPPGRARQTNGFELVTAHLEMARRDPQYKFVLAEVDYLKPYWDTHPQQRAYLRTLLDQGRVEIMGGTYNEPNTNLTSPETAIRNFVHGIGFQRDVMGANPQTAWQLDVFGHDPQFPGMAADAGLTSSSWARGPHHQWGPMHRDGDPERMQFASEFDWIAPSGRGLLTHYMPAHYSAGWWMDSAATLTEAEKSTYETFTKLKKVALTRNVLLPVGTDYTPPNKWVTDIHRDWSARYTWPRFICAVPGEFFAAVRAELADRGAAASPQTRDMNPIYTGKDVSYIDTKQANRAAENAVLEAERFAVFAGLLTGATYPQAALAKAWVQLAYGAHHDAITGSESDQVYLDLLTGWRDAWELGRATRDSALRLLSRAVDADIVVWNPLAHSRTDIVTMRLAEPLGGVLVEPDGTPVPILVEDDGHTVTWLATDVPSLGWRSYRMVGEPVPDTWEPLPGTVIESDLYRCEVDPQHGGAVSSLRRSGIELIAPGGFGNELAVYDEYPAHPTENEGPWHLLPKGPVVGSAEFPAEHVRAFRSALGERLVIGGRIAGLLRYTQTITLWNGVDRVDCRTVVDEFAGADQLLRLRWHCPVPGAMPVSEVGDAVIGRGFGLLHHHDSHHHADAAVDTAEHPYTLDNPAYGWFGLSSAARIRVRDGDGESVRALSVAEVVTAGQSGSTRDLMVALVRAGVTATSTTADRSRYGDLSVDSNLPDVRIALGGPRENAFTAAVLAAADPMYAAELERQGGSARVWVPADRDLAQRWVPGADLRGVRALPVLIVVGAVSDLIADLDDAAAAPSGRTATVTVEQRVPARIGSFDARTVAVFNRGVPGFAIEPDGVLHTSLLRSCTGWPSGTWIDPPRRTAPDGSNFQLQHWTHTFDYAVAAGDGDWRASAIPGRSAAYSHPLIAVHTGDPAVSGGLSATGSMLSLEPAGDVALGALKAAGNPIAAGSGAAVDPRSGITLRLVQTTGRPTRVRIASGLRHLQHPERVDLLERPTGHGPVLDLHGYEIATVRARLDLPHVLNGEAVTLGADAEAVQPIYARYWLHNRGPAPLGGLPAMAYLHPNELAAQPGQGSTLRLTAASDCADRSLHGRVRLIVPPGWMVTPDELPFVLPPGEYLEAEVDVTIPTDVAPGRYPLRAELSVTGADNHAPVPASWLQTVEDVCVVTVGDCATELLTIIDEPHPVAVVAGERAELSVTVGTDAGAPLCLEAHLISPWGTWEWLRPNIIGAELAAGGTAALTFEVAPPVGTTPGQWWALVRIAAAGRLLYTPAVAVTVR